MNKYKYPVVLSIAGSDSGGGAGIQADLKTISALGCFAATAITAITVQNTLGVSAIHQIPVKLVIAQIKAVMDDLKPSAIKIGMVHSSELAMFMAEILRHYQQIPIIFDPVMVASSGDRLIEESTIATFKEQLFPLAEIITPNLDEAAILANMEIKTIYDMKEAGSRLLKYGCNAVLIKGGHLEGSELCDVYLHKNGYEYVFRSRKIYTLNTHGTGCTLSSAIASYIALGHSLTLSISKSEDYTHRAIEHGKNVICGAGQGPINHFFDPQRLVVIKQFRKKFEV